MLAFFNDGQLSVLGDAGNDLLSSGFCKEVMLGGTGADTFVHSYRPLEMGGQTVRRYDELLIDLNLAEGDRTEEFLFG